jgi:hypothetical protein
MSKFWREHLAEAKDVYAMGEHVGLLHGLLLEGDERIATLEQRLAKYEGMVAVPVETLRELRAMQESDSWEKYDEIMAGIESGKVSISRESVEILLSVLEDMSTQQCGVVDAREELRHAIAAQQEQEQEGKDNG